jgi:hypothetical protein
MAAEVARLKHQVDVAMKDVSRRLFGRASAQVLRLASFEILDVPFAGVHRHIAANEMPCAYVDDLSAKAYSALITSAQASGRNRK